MGDRKTTLQGGGWGQQLGRALQLSRGAIPEGFGLPASEGSRSSLTEPERDFTGI